MFMQIIMSSNSPGPHANLSPEGHSLISSILVRNPDDRPTIPEIMEHEWFAGVDWIALGRREVVPPWVPSEASVPAMESGIIHL